MDKSFIFLFVGLHPLDSTCSQLVLGFAGLGCLSQRLLAWFVLDGDGLAGSAVLRNFFGFFVAFDRSSTFLAEFTVFWGHSFGVAGFRDIWDQCFHVLSTALSWFDLGKCLLQGNFVLVVLQRCLILGGNFNILVENLLFLELINVWNHLLFSLWMSWVDF